MGDTSDLFRALADHRRRIICRFFLEADTGSADLKRLAEHVAAAEFPETRTPPPEEVDLMVISLHHVHLPLLADAGVIEYDRHRGEVHYVGDRIIEQSLALLGDR